MQQLVDCSKANDGCDGGSSSEALTYATKYGITPNANYPYAGKQSTCGSLAGAFRFTKGFKTVPVDVDEMKKAVYTQPVAVAIQADQAIFQNYRSGVFKSGCGSETNHVVLLIGYGLQTGIDAWTIKNSWGTSWGVNGYGFIATDDTYNDGNGACGILSNGVAPTSI